MRDLSRDGLLSEPADLPSQNQIHESSHKRLGAVLEALDLQVGEVDELGQLPVILIALLCELPELQILDLDFVDL